MNNIISKVQIIDQALSYTSNNYLEIDNFTILKTDVANQIKDIKNMIITRDNLYKKENSKKVVELSALIRKGIRELEEKEKEMTIINNKKSNETKLQIINLVHSHIQECKILDKNRYERNKPNTSNYINLTLYTNKTPLTTLQSLDDPDIENGLSALRKKDNEIDIELGVLSSTINRLKDSAVNIKQEVNIQNNMLDQLSSDVDNSTEKLLNLNSKLKNILDKNGCSNIIIYIILIILILGCSCYIYTIIKN